ncbi:amidohydrolase family protein [Leifsonia sp. AG29]|uniref:amidohydrolase family protein n=1 Tax=Leifsonia sp. AG29 TaxID=2598860 RepID=UPI00131C5737|nr:amidohydrolase family protein [Leifsonia sp. AG29]
MIIDAYNNIWEASGTSDYLTAESYTPELILAHMDEAGVDMAVGCSLGQSIDNAYIASIVEAHPDRFIGFGQVNPRFPGAVETLRECARLGLKGIKLHPTLHGYHFADHGLLDPIFQAATEEGLVLLVNALDDPWCAPLAIEEISRNFPEAPVLIAHMGTVWNVTEALIVAERNPHIYLETSSTQLLEVQMAYKKLGPERIVMGTDWPGSHFALERAKIARAIPNEADRRLVEGENLARVLNLRTP